MRETGRVIDFGNLLFYLPNILPLGILEKLKFCYNQKKEEITTPQHRRICVICKPEKQLIRDASCTENYFP